MVKRPHKPLGQVEWSDIKADFAWGPFLKFVSRVNMALTVHSRFDDIKSIDNLRFSGYFSRQMKKLKIGAVLIYFSWHINLCNFDI